MGEDIELINTQSAPAEEFGDRLALEVSDIIYRDSKRYPYQVEVDF